MKIEELRPLQGGYNKDIVPVIKLLQAIYESRYKELPYKEVKELLGAYGTTLQQLDYLEAHRVIKVSYVSTEVRIPLFVSMENKVYDESFDFNLLENSKTIFKNLEPPVFLYELAKLLIMRYEVEDLPYIIDVLEFENIVETV
jgi:hypothetical protein